MIRASSFEELFFPETMVAGAFSLQQRLNMELDLQSLFGFPCTAVLIGWDPQGADPPPLPLHVATASKNHLNEGITPLLPTVLGERCSQTISNFGHVQSYCADVNSSYKQMCWTNSWALLLIHYSELGPPPPHLGSYTRALLVSQDRDIYLPPLVSRLRENGTKSLRCPNATPPLYLDLMDQYYQSSAGQEWGIRDKPSPSR